MDDSTNKPPQPACLFPAYASTGGAASCVSQSTVSSSTPESLTIGSGWLQNHSYIPGSEANEHDEIEDVISEAEPAGTRELGKHRLISSDESSEDEKTSRDHHKKTKKDKKHKKKKKKKHKKRKYQSDEDEPVSRSVSVPGLIPTVTGKVFLEDLPEPSNSSVTFSIDKSADRNNFTYQSIYKMNVARHHTAKCCLGAGDRERVAVGKKTILRYFQVAKKSKQPSDHENLPVMEEDTPELVTRVRDDIDELGEFVPVSESSLEPPKTDQEPTQTRSESIRKRTEDYNRRLAKDPSDADLWLEFIGFQEETFRDGEDLGIGKSTKETERLKKQSSLVDQLKEAIFDRAIKENPGNVTLKLEYLNFCHGMWEHSKLLKEWKQLLFVHPNNLTVWKKYLEFVETNVTSFTVTKLLKEYKKCLHVLKGISLNQVKSHPPQLGTMDFMIETLMKLCYRLRQSGHEDRAVGLLQGVLEYGLFPPPDDLVTVAPELRLEYFTAFWESDAARVGETGALGWAAWVQGKGQVPPHKPWRSKEVEEELEDDLLQKSRNKWMLWRALEESRAERHWLPWRPDVAAGETTDSCEDPEGLVLADDITDAFFEIPSNVHKLKLVCLVLEFLGLPEVAPISAYVSQLDPRFILEHMAQINNRISVDTLKETKHAEKSRCEFMSNVIEQARPVFKESICLRSKLLVTRRQYLEWSLTQGHQTQAEIRTAAKQLLQEDPYRGEMLPWQQYALLECHLGNLSTARKVLNKTISGLCPDVNSIADANTQTIALYLWRTYVEMELGLLPTLSCVKKPAGKQDKNAPRQSAALRVLAALCEGPFTEPSDNFELSATQTVKYLRQLEAKTAEPEISKELDEEERMFADTVGTAAEHWAVCRELFVYLTSGLSAVTDMHQQTLSRLPSLSVRERVTEAHVRLVARHVAGTTPTPLATLRDPLTLALESSPDNPDLLAQYIALELRSTFTSRLRRLLTRLCRRTRSATTWLLSVLAEISKIQRLRDMAKDPLIPEVTVSLPEVGLVQVVRSWFERALDSPAARGCVLIWRLYLGFEVEYGKQENVKAIFYRSLQQCPWSKALCMDYCKSTPFAYEEILDLMTEKEMRVHTPPEEVDILLESVNSPTNLADQTS